MNPAVDFSPLTDDELAAAYAWPTGKSLRLNMLLDPHGSATGSDGTSHSLTSTMDRRILRLIRSQADVVVVGASSVRTEGWFLPPQGLLVVLTKSGNLPWDSCPDRQRVVSCASISELATWLQEHPGRQLCEGGLTTAHALDSAVGFDQIALTAHLPADKALALVTDHPTEFELTHASRSSQPAANNSEGFFLWRRAEPRKD